MFDFVKKIRNDKYALYLLAFSIFITIALICINSTTNILGRYYVDAYFYLIQSLRYSGYHIGGYAFINYFPPLVPFLTSLLFRLGLVGDYSIFAVTGVFYIFAVLGVYYLLKLRFEDKLAAIGAFFYGSLSINIMWVANGTIDIPSIALSIWALYTFILAIEKNQKYFYLVIPLAVLSFFAKYIGGLIIPIMIIYVLSKKDIFGNICKYIKHFIGGTLLSFIFIIPFLVHYYINKIPFGFLNQAANISDVSNKVSSAVTVVPHNDLLYYLFFIPRFVCRQVPLIGIPILIAAIIGIIYIVFRFRKSLLINDSKIENKCSLSFLPKIKLHKNIYYCGLFGSIILFLVSFLLASKVSFIILEGLFFIGVLIFSISFNSLFNDFDNYKWFNYDLTMFVWFVSYLIFFSSHLVKADRYFIVFAPSFVALIISSLNITIEHLELYSAFLKKNFISYDKSERITTKIKVKLAIWNDDYNLSRLIPVVFICIFLITNIGYLTMDKHDTLVDDEKDLSLWIKNNIPNYDKINIWADRGPIFTWYLQTEIHYNKDTMSLEELSTFLNDKNASYYITCKNSTIPGFKIIKNIGEVNLYKNERVI